MIKATPEDVIIIGAGVVGLTLAHGLKKHGIPFQIYERDDSVSARGQGWAITIHWALPYLKDLLSAETLAEIDKVQVDPAIGRNDTGNFLFINLSNCETKYRIPPSERRRVNREKLRAVLLRDVQEHVRWSKRLAAVDVSHGPNNVGRGSVKAIFEDGTSAVGALLVGADGSNSRVRKFLRPDDYRNRQLPIRFLGSGVDMTTQQVRPLRQLDPLLFQGCHPETGCFMWVSMLETPAVNGTENTAHERYRVQLNLSWPVKDPDGNDEVKATDRERVADMKRRARVFAPVLRDAINTIPDDAAVLEIKLADWPCLDWDNHAGAVTLVGDAAHAMTMYRGEAANHGMLDAYRLCETLKKVYTDRSVFSHSPDDAPATTGESEDAVAQAQAQAQTQAIADFEREMRTRTSHAVQMSRQACFDAHDWDRLNEHSAVLTKRAVDAK